MSKKGHIKPRPCVRVHPLNYHTGQEAGSDPLAGMEFPLGPIGRGTALQLKHYPDQGLGQPIPYL